MINNYNNLHTKLFYEWFMENKDNLLIIDNEYYITYEQLMNLNKIAHRRLVDTNNNNIELSDVNLTCIILDNILLSKRDLYKYSVTEEISSNLRNL